MRTDEAIIKLCEVIRRIPGAGSTTSFKDFEPIEKHEGGYWVISSKGDKLYNVDEYGRCDCPAGKNRGKCRHGDKVEEVSETSHGELERISRDGIVRIAEGRVERA